jgi:CheY-like chemotaxis protein
MRREQLPSEPAPVVLIVEDDVLLRLTIAGSLRDAGFEVLEAANAAEAVQILKCIPVDALFSDIDMPGRMDGCALAQWVHQHALNTRIILTSSPDRTLGEAGDYVSFVPKPYGSAEVEYLLRSVLPSP